MCMFGLGSLRGDGFRIGVGLYFLEFGVRFTPRKIYYGTIQGLCTNCEKEAVLQLYKDRFLMGGTIVNRCTLCGDEVIDPNMNQEPLGSRKIVDGVPMVLVKAGEDIKVEQSQNP